MSTSTYERVDQLKSALEARGLPGAWHSKILDACSECGLVAGAMHAVADDIQKIVQASNHERIFNIVKAQASAELSRIGVRPDAKGRVDILELNKALREHGILPERRIAIKAMLAQIGAID